ncbi:MAG: hypothetical protein AAGG79_00485 [Pseudomonadota bacterium]
MPRCVPGVALVQDDFSPARAQVFEVLAAAEAPEAQTIIPSDSSIGRAEIHSNHRGRMIRTNTKAYQDWKVH